MFSALDKQHKDPRHQIILYEKRQEAEVLFRDADKLGLYTDDRLVSSEVKGHAMPAKDYIKWMEDYVRMPRNARYEAQVA